MRRPESGPGADGWGGTPSGSASNRCEAGQLVMTQMILVGLGAGFATALLFASVASGSLLSILLFYLAPLPILIAALGWSHWSALIAALSAAAGLALFLGPFFFIAFLIGVGLPAWWLGYLALLARPDAAAPDGFEWYPAGRLLFWAAILAAAIVIMAIPNFGLDEESFRGALRRAFERVLRVQTRTAPEAPLSVPGVDAGRLIDLLVAVIPLAAAVVATITNTVNLYLAGRIVKVSGRLRRPWPDLPAVRFPAYAPALLAGAIAVSFLPGLVGTIAGILSAALLMAYGLLGLAVLHTITRQTGARPFLLATAYAAVFVFGWPMLAFIMLGLIDTIFDLRGRAARRTPPAPPVT